jgi:hypothetical protein
VVAAFIACVLEGALRKWVINPDYRLLKYSIYFSKDALFLFCLTLPAKHANASVTRLKPYILLGAAMVLLGGAIASVTDFSLVGAVLTIRALIVLPVAAILIASRLPQSALWSVITAISVMAAANVPLSIAQFYSSPHSFINKYERESKYGAAVIHFTNNVRATGTFSFLTGLGIFAVLSVSVGLAALGAARSKREVKIGYIAIAAGLICGGATASRSVAIGVVAMLVVWAVLSKKRSRQLWTFIVLAGVAYGGLALAGKFSAVADVMGAVVKRQNTASDTFAERFSAPFMEALQAVSEVPLGQGLGTEQVAGNYMRGVIGFTTYETEFPRVVMECGIIGFLGYALIHLSTIYEIFRLRQQSTSDAAKSVYLAVVLALGVWLMGGVVFNHVSSFFFWALVACVMAASQPATAAAAPQPAPRAVPPTPRAQNPRP